MPLTTTLDQVIPQEYLDQLYELGVYVVQQQDAIAKRGVAESAAARGQAWLDIGTLMGPLLDAETRSALARAPIDVLLRFLELAIQLEIVRIRNAHELELETLRFSHERQLILDRRDAEISIIEYRFVKNNAMYQDYLALADKVYDRYLADVQFILDYIVSGDAEALEAGARVVAAKASAVRTVILPPAPPFI
jgi:hypothetical protein